MSRVQYVSDPSVACFAHWLAEELKANAMYHRGFNGLSDAFKNYSWPFSFCRPDTHVKLKGESYNDSCQALNVLELNIAQAVKSHDDNSLRQWCRAVVKWGGVSNGNNKWFDENNHLVHSLHNTCELLIDGDEEKLKEIDRFNAGMTKVYSLLVPGLIIYDSRVAGALAWFVVRWCRHSHRLEVPTQLQFPCMRAKEGANAAVRKIRNPSVDGYRFPYLNGSARRHAQWNLRASWVLREALDLATDTDFHHQSDALRALEAAFFMWGYDLRESRPNA